MTLDGCRNELFRSQRPGNQGKRQPAFHKLKKGGRRGNCPCLSCGKEFFSMDRSKRRICNTCTFSEERAKQKQAHRLTLRGILRWGV